MRLQIADDLVGEQTEQQLETLHKYYHEQIEPLFDIHTFTLRNGNTITTMRAKDGSR